MGMIINPYLVQPSGPSYGTLTTAWIAATGETDLTILGALNTLESNLATYGLTSKMKALYPFVGGTAAKHKFNFMDARDLDAAFRLVFNGGWTHSSTGILPNSVNTFADTKFNPVSQSSSQNNFFLSVYSRTNASGLSYEIGNADTWTSGDKFTGIIAKYSNGNRYISICDAYSSSNAESDSRGFYCGGTNSSTTQILYKNGTNVLSGTSQQSGFSNCNIVIGAVNSLTSSPQINGYSNKELAFASLSTGLSSTEAANFYTAVQTFQTTLSRNV